MNKLDFKTNLSAGNRYERILCNCLKSYGIDARLTPQEPGNRTPELGNVDVVIYEFGRPVLGIECKLITEEFRNSPYGHDTVPINLRSLRTYESVDFPVWISAISSVSNRIYSASLEKVTDSPYFDQEVGYKRDIIRNFDASGWTVTFTIIDTLKQITGYDFD